MKMLLNAAVLILLSAVVSAAQWAPHPTPGVPKLPDGKPNLEGPAPRTRDGKPDLSGIWQNGRGGGGGGGGGNAAGGGAAGPGGGAAGQRGQQAAGGGQRGQGGQGGGANAAAPRGAAPAPAAPAAAQAAPTGPPNVTFGNAGAGFPGGLPYTPWAAELVKKRMADNSKDNPDAHCLPMGFMQYHTHPQPRKIVQTPEITLIIYEANSGLRQIFTDGRSLPDKDAQPWWYGYSVGKWEGDTLVVETTGFLDTTPLWLDVRGSPLTEAARVIERFRRPNFGTLEMEMTIDDPKSYTKPWTVKLTQRIMLDTELIEFICEERDATHYVGAEQKTEQK